MIVKPSDWIRLVAGLIVIYALFQWSAGALGSNRGEAGAIVAAIIVAATIIIERTFFGTGNRDLVAALGFGTPTVAGLAASFAVTALLVAMLLLFPLITGTRLTLQQDWMRPLPGLFLQAGIAEEVLFRGWLFGHLRQGRSFQRAALVSMIPFAAVHLYLFLTLSWPIATAAFLLSIVIAVPMAWLYEVGGRTIWAPAVVHAVIQGVPKIIDVRDGSPVIFAIAWMCFSAVAPILVSAFWPRRRTNAHTFL